MGLERLQQWRGHLQYHTVLRHGTAVVANCIGVRGGSDGNVTNTGRFVGVARPENNGTHGAPCSA